MTENTDKQAEVAAKLAIPIDEAPITFKMIEQIADTDMIPGGLRNKPKAIVACILTGREFGLGPMESLRLIDVIDGKPSPSGELMLRLIKEKGHKVKLLELTDTKCKLAGIREEDPKDVMELEFTWKDAERVTVNRDGKKLVEKDNWKNYPKHMLFWRAVSMLASFQFPDAIRGRIYVGDELGSEEWVEEIDPEAIEMTPALVSSLPNAPQRPHEPEEDDDPEVVDAVIVEDSDPTPETAENGEAEGTPTPDEKRNGDEIGEGEAQQNLIDVGLVEDDTEAWSELYALAATTNQGAQSGTMKDIEARTRHLYQLAEKTGLWSNPDGSPFNDVLHLALQHHAKVDHFSNLGNKPAKQKFAAWSFQKARKDLKAVAQKQAQEETTE